MTVITGNESRRLEWAGYVARMWLRRDAYRIFVGKSEGMRPFERPKRRWDDNVKTELREVGWGGMDWIDLAQDRDRKGAVANAAMNLQVP